MNAQLRLVLRPLIYLLAFSVVSSTVLGAEPNRPAPPPAGTPPGSTVDTATEQAARELLHKKISELGDTNTSQNPAATNATGNSFSGSSPARESSGTDSFATLAALQAVVPEGNKPGAMPKTTEDQKLYSFHAEGQDLKQALAFFAQANGLNIVPDQDVIGEVTIDIHDLPLNKMLQALLEANDFSWTDDKDGLIRVRALETRLFSIDYLRLSRKGIGQSTATLGSGGGAGFGGAGGGSGGGAGGGTGGGQGAGGGGGGSGGGISSSISSGSSSVNLTADNPVDFWKEITEELGFMLTEAGKHSLSINKTAGLIQIHDRPSALKRVEKYLASVDKSVHRQVEIEAKLYDVTLSDQFQFGIDWVHVVSAYGGTLGFGGATLPLAIGGAQLQDSAIGGINHLPVVGTSAATTPGGNLSTLVFQNFNSAAAVNALKQQGRVEVIATPRIRTLNNQTAMIKVGEEVPFFNSRTTIIPGVTSGTSTVLSEGVISSITVGTILSLTPQISSDDWISLEITPVLTSLKAVVSLGAPSSGSSGGAGGGGNSSATAPDLDTKQASSIVRVRDGTTIVLGGLIQTEKARSEKKIPLLGDIPWLGRLFTGTLNFNQKKELVIFVTPHIVQ